MKIDIISEDEKQMELLLIGENHTYANLLRSYLQKDEHVVFAAYNVAHSLLDYEKPKVKIKTDGTKTPRQAIVDANKILLEGIKFIKKTI